MEITPVDGAEIEKLVKDLHTTPPAVVQKAAAMIR
jgi:hypothetical protein